MEKLYTFKYYLLLISMLLHTAIVSHAQNIIANQSFENSIQDTWNYSGSGARTTAKSNTGSYSLQSKKSTDTFDAVSVEGYSGVQVLLHTSAYGVENADALNIYVALNGQGFSSIPDVTLQGINRSPYNTSWEFSANGEVRTQAGTPTTYVASQGGSITDGPARVIIDIPDGSTSVSVKLASSGVKKSETFYVDDLNLLGTPAKSSEKEILSFTINGQAATINGNNISMQMPNGIDLTTLTPQIAISPKASVNPASGTMQNFTQAVEYTVTAEDGSIQVYTISITEEPAVNASLLINELDVDQASTDTAEFIELYDGGTGNTSLDGYCLVLYNGNGNTSYKTIDLNGYQTNSKGFFLLGNTGVPGIGINIPSSSLQNGADAVAIYQAAASDFPNGTSVTTQNLVDAVVYGTDDATATGLMVLLTNGNQVNESGGGDPSNHSIYRSTDGAGGARNTSNFIWGTPTPGLSNSGITGTPQVNLSLSATSGKEAETTAITITANTDQVVSGDQTLTVSVSGTNITASDYTLSNTNITIEGGSTSGSVTFTIADDSEDETTEVATLTLTNPSNGIELGQIVSATISIFDNDGVAVSYGTPMNPTYGQINSTAPINFYDAINNKVGQQLRDVLQTIVVNATTKGQNYGDIWDILKEADENPENPNQVWLVYTEKGLDKTQQDGQASGEVWNREHVFPQSLGGFADGTSRTADGKDKYFSTSADDLNHGHADGHHLRAALKNENSARSNRSYADVSGPRTNTANYYEPPLSSKGDVARAVLYMEIRYNALSVVEGYGTTGSYTIGDLPTLLRWHKEDPVDDFEMQHNNVVYDWQNNRNPFIDLPELVDYIWGDKVGQSWTGSGAVIAASTPTSDMPVFEVQTLKTGQVRMYPNPANDFVQIDLPGEEVKQIRIFSANGNLISTHETYNNLKLDVSQLSKGVYILQIKTAQAVINKRLVIL